MDVPRTISAWASFCVSYVKDGMIPASTIAMNLNIKNKLKLELHLFLHCKLWLLWDVNKASDIQVEN